MAIAKSGPFFEKLAVDGKTTGDKGNVIDAMSGRKFIVTGCWSRRKASTGAGTGPRISLGSVASVGEVIGGGGSGPVLGSVGIGQIEQLVFDSSSAFAYDMDNPLKLFVENAATTTTYTFDLWVQGVFIDEA